MSKKQYQWAASLHQCYADLPNNCKRHWKVLTTLDGHNFCEPTYCWEPKWNITTWELAKCAPMFAAGAIPVNASEVMADLKNRKEKIASRQRNTAKGSKGKQTKTCNTQLTTKQRQQDKSSTQIERQ